MSWISWPQKRRNCAVNDNIISSYVSGYQTEPHSTTVHHISTLMTNNDCLQTKFYSKALSLQCFHCVHTCGVYRYIYIFSNKHNNMAFKVKYFFWLLFLLLVKNSVTSFSLFLFCNNMNLSPEHVPTENNTKIRITFKTCASLSSMLITVLNIKIFRRNDTYSVCLYI